MTQRTLRYSHPELCPGKSVDRNEIPVKKRIKQEAPEKQENKNKNADIPEEVIINHLQKLRENRKKEKEEKLKKLISQIT